MKTDIKNWMVKVYNKNNKRIDEFIIKNRTENQARKEAENDISVKKGDSWTMTEIILVEKNES